MSNIITTKTQRRCIFLLTQTSEPFRYRPASAEDSRLGKSLGQFLAGLLEKKKKKYAIDTESKTICRARLFILFIASSRKPALVFFFGIDPILLSDFISISAHFFPFLLSLNPRYQLPWSAKATRLTFNWHKMNCGLGPSPCGHL